MGAAAVYHGIATGIRSRMMPCSRTSHQISRVSRTDCGFNHKSTIQAMQAERLNANVARSRTAKKSDVEENIFYPFRFDCLR